jgi:hypothetical protein
MSERNVDVKVEGWSLPATDNSSWEHQERSVYTVAAMEREYEALFSSSSEQNEDEEVEE